MLILSICVMVASAAARAEDAPQLARPTAAQVAFQDMEVGMFLHFGLYSFPFGESQLRAVSGQKAEDIWHWPQNRADLMKFNPEKLDTDQWVDAAEAMGAKYIVLTVKHSLGFCMWQTETTEFSIKNTPWRDGKGDILAELAASCKKRGMKLGVYLSPSDEQFGAPNGKGGWCPDPEDQKRYNKIFRQQLTEVLTEYGDVCEIWFDGNLFVPVGDILKKHAPNIMVFQSPHSTLRWVGTETGYAPYPAWNAVKRADAADGAATGKHGDPNGDVWMPLECDTTIRRNWMYTPGTEHTLKSVDKLMDIYYGSVGRGSVLLMNNAPGPDGLIPEIDMKQTKEFGDEIRRRFSKSLASTSGEGETITLEFDQPTTIDHAIIMEKIAEGERIRVYQIEGWTAEGSWKKLTEGTSVGHKKIDSFKPVVVSKVRLRVTQSAAKPLIQDFSVYSVKTAK